MHDSKAVKSSCDLISVVVFVVNDFFPSQFDPFSYTKHKKERNVLDTAHSI